MTSSAVSVDHVEHVPDPSGNVSDLVEATALRLDDLLHAERAHARSASKALRREMIVRLDGIQNEIRLRADYEEKLSVAESHRINSTRTVDVAASTADKVVQETRASALAQQTTASADTLRNQVSEAAAAQTIALDGVVSPIKAEIAAVREIQYRQAGERAQIAESRDVNRDSRSEMAPILLAIEKLTLAQAAAGGGHAQVAEGRAKSVSVALWIGLAIAFTGMASTFLFSVAGVIITLLVTMQ